VAMIRALSTFLGNPFSNDEVNQVAFEIEKFHHGSPSGIDNTVITYEKILFFIKSKPYEFLHPRQPITLVIADSGIKSSTGKVVEEVRQHSSSNPERYEDLFSQIAEISLSAKRLLESGKLESLGKSMTENHHLLQKMGVSCSKLDDLVECAMKNGALGAKLSGGGQGGNMIALVNPSNADEIAYHLKAAGAVNTIITHVPVRG